MDSTALGQALRRIPLLSGLSTALLDEVARVTSVTELRRGATVFAYRVRDPQRAPVADARITVFSRSGLPVAAAEMS